MAIKLYDLEPSGNCYKVRLMCAFLGVPLELIPVDFMAGAHKKPPLIDINPFGEIPILDDDGFIIRDSQAILVYLARKFGGETWLPAEPKQMARVMEWLSAGGNEIMRGPGDARLHDKFGYDIDVTLARKKAAHILGLMEAHLSKNNWLALGRPTIADIACLPYVGVGHEGGVPLTDYPAIRAWIARIKALPGFVTMPEL
jgi:glutathione S-transferase